MSEKVCTKCGATKPFEAFSKRTVSKDGHSPSCKACCALANRERREPGYAEGVEQRRANSEANIEGWLAAQRKPCSSCGVEKPFSEFRKSTKGRLGLCSLCRDCGNAASLKCGQVSYVADPEKFRKRKRDARAANPAKVQKQARGYYAVDPEKFKKRASDAYAADPEKFKKRTRARREANPEHVREVDRARDAANPGKRSAKDAKRRAAKLHRTPPWADLEAIEEFYINRPPGYHGDHEIPLQGELVSGLHVLANLQYLTGPENLAKSNSFTPDDWYWTKND